MSMRSVFVDIRELLFFNIIIIIFGYMGDLIFGLVIGLSLGVAIRGLIYSLHHILLIIINKFRD